MSRMSEYAAEEEQRRNDSGYDEAQEWEDTMKENQRMMKGFDVLRPAIEGTKAYQDIVGDFEKIFTGVK